MGNIWTLFVTFSIYSFLGWLTESIFCSIPEGKFINRGFLNGPFCPIYGVGAILVIATLSPLQNNLPVLYIVSVLLTSTVEYFTGFLLEKIFHTRYWDYSDQKFNLQGRVCLLNSLLFGLMCLVGILFIHPFLLHLLGMIPENIMPYIAVLLIIYFASDTVMTVWAVEKLNGKLDELQQVLNEIRQRAAFATSETIDNIRSTINGWIDEDAKARIDALFDRLDKMESGSKAIQRRLISAFPKMKSIQNNESLQHMKQAIAERTKNIGKKRKQD